MATLEVPGFTERLSQRFGMQSLNQTQFCEKHGFKQPQFSEWLSGTIPEFKSVVRLAEVFGVPWQWLVVGDEGAEEVLRWRREKKR